MLNDPLQAEKFEILNGWFLQPQGIRVADAFTMELKPFREQLHGGKLIQLGSGGQHPWLTSLRYRSKYIISPNLPERDISLCASVQALPLERHSIDCIIAPMTVETTLHAMPLIEEIDRVLKPMGYVIFLGINPFSLWGLALKTGYLNCFTPHTGTLMSSLTLKQHYLNRGYRQCVLSSFYFIPPIHNPNLIQKLAFLNPMGKMIWPFPAGFYCLIMQKFETLPPALYANNLVLAKS